MRYHSVIKFALSNVIG